MIDFTRCDERDNSKIKKSIANVQHPFKHNDIEDENFILDNNDDILVKLAENEVNSILGMPFIGKALPGKTYKEQLTPSPPRKKKTQRKRRCCQCGFTTDSLLFKENHPNYNKTIDGKKMSMSKACKTPKEEYKDGFPLEDSKRMRSIQFEE